MAQVLSFAHNFSIHDDCDVLRCMRLAEASNATMMRVLPKGIGTWATHGRREPPDAAEREAREAAAAAAAA